MSETKHSPAPWTPNYNGCHAGNWWEVVDANGRVVAVMRVRAANGVFDEVEEEANARMCAAGPGMADEVERLRAEVERCRAEKQELVRRLEGLMDDWYDRRNELRDEAGGGPCTEAGTLEDCAEELNEVLDEAEGKITPGA